MLGQGVSMVLLVSALFSVFYQVVVDHHPDSIPFYFLERGGHGLGTPRLRLDFEAWGAGKNFSRRMKEKLQEEKELR